MIWIVAFTWLTLSALTLLFIAGAHASQRPELVEVRVEPNSKKVRHSARSPMPSAATQKEQRAFPSSSAILPYDVAIRSPSDGEQAS